jgi:hypothetical protein
MFDIDKITSFLGVFGVTAFIILRDKDKYNNFLKLIKMPMFTINILVVVAFSYYMLTSDDNTEEGMSRKEATKQALLGLLIALMAHLEMKIAPFWLIWNASYYLNA